VEIQHELERERYRREKLDRQAATDRRQREKAIDQ